MRCESIAWTAGATASTHQRRQESSESSEHESKRNTKRREYDKCYPTYHEGNMVKSICRHRQEKQCCSFKNETKVIWLLNSYRFTYSLHTAILRHLAVGPSGWGTVSCDCFLLPPEHQAGPELLSAILVGQQDEKTPWKLVGCFHSPLIFCLFQVNPKHCPTQQPLVAVISVTFRSSSNFSQVVQSTERNCGTAQERIVILCKWSKWFPEEWVVTQFPDYKYLFHVVSWMFIASSSQPLWLIKHATAASSPLLTALCCKVSISRFSNVCHSIQTACGFVKCWVTTIGFKTSFGIRIFNISMKKRNSKIVKKGLTAMDWGGCSCWVKAFVQVPIHHCKME